jgi:peptidoglycan/LPS O-acetylase OafA/YrhL
MTLGHAFESRRNSLNAIRLFLAACVIISHSWYIGGYGPEPELDGWNLGRWALIGFFGISGYLVTMSRLSHRSSTRYVQARALRILPGLWVCVPIVAFVIAPTTAWLSGRQYSLNDAAEFGLRNALLLAGPLGPRPIGQTLAGIPDTQLWNGPLWTLFWEVFCYLIVGICGAVFQREIFRLAMSLLFAIGTAGLVLTSLVTDLSYWVSNGPIAPLTAFFAGSMVFCFKDRVALTSKTFAPLLILTGVAMTFGFGKDLSILPFTILLLMLSFFLPFQKFGSRFDISYGMYIYGWPVQQCLALAGLHLVIPAFAFSLVSLCATLPLAWLSCAFVEGPAQRFGRRRHGPARASERSLTGTAPSIE